ncbi:transcriptional regulator [Sporosarcina sp. P13]|nr:transcriptional regulator [Sporosarcina sp. P13]
MRDEAYDILQNWIIAGKLEPGALLRDQDLSDLLGISRTPIREALLRLERDGLVVTKPNRSTTVTQVHFEEAANIYLLVETLESLAMDQAFPNITDDVIREMEELNEQFIDQLHTGDKVAAFQIDSEFHQKIIDLSNNPELVKLLANLKIKVQRMEIYYFSLADNGEKSIHEHKVIIDSLKKKCKKSAKEAIQSNWRNSLSRMMDRNLE